MIEISSGRTQSVKDKLEKWYEKEKEHISEDSEEYWDWGFRKESIQDFLDGIEEISFKHFFIRYLLAVHIDVFHLLLCTNLNGSDWLNESAEKILYLMNENKNANYDTAPDIIQKFVDQVVEDFKSNEPYKVVNERGKKKEKVLGSVNKRTPRGGRQIWWDKDDLLRKLSADTIDSDELFAFGFGLNMPYEDISYLMRKALRRTDFNLWDWKEFLLYITFRYAKGNLFAFYIKLKEAYENEENGPLEYAWGNLRDFSTKMISDKIAVIVDMMSEENYSMSLDNSGELPPQIITYIRYYKYLTENAYDYTRTISRESANLVDEIQKYAESEKSLDKDEGVYAQGEVKIFYDPQKGLDVPKGTQFYKIESKPERRIAFESLEDVHIEPSDEQTCEITIKLISAESEKKMERPEQQRAFILKHTQFRTDNPYLSCMRNKSMFKLPIKDALGKKIFISGKITANSKIGKEIPKGTKFFAKNPQEEDIEFRSTETIKTDFTKEVKVRCLEIREEASKNQITECSIPDWKERFIRLENSKIKLRPPKVQSEGTIYSFLYSTEQVKELEKILDEKYFDKVDKVLKGTKISATKLRNIKIKKEKNITRNDLLTLCFLTYVIEEEHEWFEWVENAETEEEKERIVEEYNDRKSGFLEKANDLLKKCGFYELYKPNSYDALLMCLLSSEEPINAFRNLWSWYLSQKAKREKTERK